MADTKLITIGIIYRPPNQPKFLDIFEENLPQVNISHREIYFPGEFNINFFENGKYVFDKSSNNSRSLDPFTKRILHCFQFQCSATGLGISDH